MPDPQAGIVPTLPTRRVLVPLDLPPATPVSSLLEAHVHVLGGETMGTTWAVKFVAAKDRPLQPVQRAVEGVLDAVVSQMSTWIADSDISRFNRAPVGTWQRLPAEFHDVLQYALTVARATGGAFSPAIGELARLWGFGPSGQRLMGPDSQSIAAALVRSDWRRLKLTGEGFAIQPGGIGLDLSGVAKGYAVDCVTDALQRLGFRSHLVEIGGELRGAGTKPDGTPWWVELEHPEPASGQLPETLVALHGLAVATSGDAQRYFVRDGRRLSHTIDPRTGHPVPDRIASVTVLHRRCMCADALATALTVLGPDGGIDYAETCGLAARFILRRKRGLEERVTTAFAAMSS